MLKTITLACLGETALAYTAYAFTNSHSDKVDIGKVSPVVAKFTNSLPVLRQVSSPKSMFGVKNSPYRSASQN